MAARFTCAAFTVTTGSEAASCLEHPAVKQSGMLKASSDAKGLSACIFLEFSRKRLQIRQRDFVPNLTVIIRVPGCSKCVLGVHNLQDRGLATLVAQGGEFQALRCQIGRVAQ